MKHIDPFDNEESQNVLAGCTIVVNLIAAFLVFVLIVSLIAEYLF